MYYGTRYGSLYVAAKGLNYAVGFRAHSGIHIKGHDVLSDRCLRGSTVTVTVITCEKWLLHLTPAAQSKMTFKPSLILFIMILFSQVHGVAGVCREVKELPRKRI